MNPGRATLRIRPDGGDVVVFVVFDGDDTTDVPIGVGATVVDALEDARQTLAAAFAKVDAAVTTAQNWARVARRAD
jgi:hypothetical protein